MSLKPLSIANILCPIDFSPSAENALERAAVLADWFHAGLTVLHVIPYAAPSPTRGQAGDRPLSMKPGEALHEVKEAARRHLKGDVRVQTEVATGEPWREIEARAASLPADLVVMGNQGARGLERLLVGSTTERTIRRLSSPILTVGPKQPAPKRAMFRRILCAVDLSRASRETVDLALAVAEENLAEVTLLHVVDGVPSRSSARQAKAADQDAAARDKLRKLAERSWTFCRTDVSVVHGTPWREIIRVAAETDVDLVVVGAHGPESAGTAFFGSTADQVLRHATSPVMIAKPRPIRKAQATPSA